MCKVGIIAIGVDLYDSAYQHFQSLLLILEAHGQHKHFLLLDLAAHFVALMTLTQCFRGRLNRQSTGRVVFPVLAVKAASSLLEEWEKGGGGSLSFKAIPVIAKTVVFLIITGKLAFGNDKSYVEPDEWFPKTKGHFQTC
mmetsp:Transcript_19188/g.32923  ORF Transcript_19188/g.32923 Transcript_19188/m.32923 type:complete len:140 (-) Transcript_19188:284-703(-)|eukprot:CAMPEP_0183702906 /NCGR_PEP_ID=MMETSP0737-20130205/852_1 /TAXON_ID=385413 /ORGANISM="Thalassiosira miniscula, Strain CCMP1093" /LENGTH=139 /DNA_ID=CAMNT_0025929589 /DNA_START=409 /DNA_END=828 /DNA_ORIENTATION=+